MSVCFYSNLKSDLKTTKIDEMRVGMEAFYQEVQWIIGRLQSWKLTLKVYQQFQKSHLKTFTEQALRQKLYRVKQVCVMIHESRKWVIGLEQ